MNTAAKNIVDINLDLLPGYAGYILANKLDLFVEKLIANYYELNIPLLKYFDSMKPEDLVRLSKESNARLLTALQEKNIAEYIETSKQNWVTNQLPIVTKDQVIVEDITLVNYGRKKTFRELLHLYTTDAGEMVTILGEIDRFILAMDSVLFKTYLSIQHDKLQETNKKLQRREEELLEAQALAQIGSFEWDLTGQNKSSFTPEVFNIFEFEKTSNLEAFLKDVVPEDRLKLQTSIEKAMHDGIYECEYRYNRFNKLKILYSRGKVFFEKGKPVRMVGTVTDVTEKATLIARLRESEELSKQGQALTNTGSWKWTLDKDRVEWSDEMYRIYGLEPQSEKITFDRFLAFIHDDDRSRRIAEITDALKTGKTSDYLMKIVTRQGVQKVLRGKSQVLFNKNHTATGMLGTCQDISHEYKLTSELKAKNEELLRTNRDLESFNFIASHDLQEPLRKIQLYAGRIETEGGTAIPQQLMKHFKKISQASGRMQKMIEDFLIFHTLLHIPEESGPINTLDVIKEIEQEYGDRISNKNATIITGNLPAINGVRPWIKEMFRHLISNALKFSRENVPLHVSIDASIEPLKDGRICAKFTVSDNGIGFDAKYSERIFDLFQKLHSKDEYPGTGIGLSLCKRIAEDHKGWIKATSQPGKGSQFSVFLPLE